MLVLSRKRDEEICLGEEIVIKVLEVRGGNVRIGIEAPRELGIRRAELPLDDPRLQDRQDGGEDAPGKETDGEV